MTGIAKCTQNNVNPPTRRKQLAGANLGLIIYARKQSKRLKLNNEFFLLTMNISDAFHCGSYECLEIFSMLRV